MPYAVHGTGAGALVASCSPMYMGLCSETWAPDLRDISSLCAMQMRCHHQSAICRTGNRAWHMRCLVLPDSHPRPDSGC